LIIWRQGRRHYRLILIVRGKFHLATILGTGPHEEDKANQYGGIEAMCHDRQY